MRLETYRLAILIAVTITAVLLLPKTFLRVADPINGPMKAVDKPPLPELPAEVDLDVYGVPHITADNETELAYTLGYVHAYMRMFQMDVMRRIAMGTLSELVGRAGLDSDEFFRRIGLHLAVEETWRTIRERYPDVAAYLEAYARGVNDYIASNPPILEYLVLGKRPEPWRPQDSIAIGKLMAWGLSGGFTDLQLARFLAVHGAEALRELELLERPLNVPIVKAPSGKLLSWLGSVDGAVRQAVGPAMSNSWAIGGSLTATGKPVLANDPHLTLSAPPIWFLARLTVPGKLDVYGATLSGVPLVVIGRNARIAWGFTNTGIDVVDFYYYKWDGDRYLYRGRWLEPSVREETIRVCTDTCEEVSLRVLETVHGPVIERGGDRYAVRWLGMGTTLEAVAFYYINRAGSLEEFVDAMRHFVVPSQNVVYADVEGKVAYFASGYFPLRDGGYLPFNGSAGEGEWNGLAWLPEATMLVDPPYVATANNKVADLGRYLQWRWADRYRYVRIVEMIEGAAKEGPITLDRVMAMQNDVVDVSCRYFVPMFLEAYRRAGRPEDVGERMDVLRRWMEEGCRFDDDSREATLYATSLLNVHLSLWGARFRKANITDWAFLPLEVTERLISRALEGDQIAVKWTGDPVRLLVDAVRNATDVRWGMLNRYQMQHPLGAVLPQLNYPTMPAPGNWFTVNVAPGQLTRVGLYVTVGPSVRIIADMSSGRLYVSLPGGQDGDPLSGGYASMLDLWASGRYEALG